MLSQRQLRAPKNKAMVLSVEIRRLTPSFPLGSACACVVTGTGSLSGAGRESRPMASGGRVGRSAVLASLGGGRVSARPVLSQSLHRRQRALEILQNVPLLRCRGEACRVPQTAPGDPPRHRFQSSAPFMIAYTYPTVRMNTNDSMLQNISVRCRNGPVCDTNCR